MNLHSIAMALVRMPWAFCRESPVVPKGHVVTQPFGQYREEIDGLRGIAILGVLLNHTHSALLPGGFVGVDVFFVISGYLITWLILRDLESNKFSMLHFYARRARRIVPAAITMIAVTLACAFFFFLPIDYKALGTSAAASTAMLANYFFYQRVDYFAAEGGDSPFLHMWSLAVEEQFYLVYPLALVVLGRFNRRAMVPALAVLLACSFGVSAYQTTTEPRAAFYLLPSRGWELLVGGLFSRLTPSRLPKYLGFGIATLAAVAIFAPMVLYSNTTPFPGFAALPPVAGTAVLLWISGSECGAVASRLLAWRPLAFIGRISYSLYLWHWPLIGLAAYPWSAQQIEMPIIIPWCAALGSFFVAYVSYAYVERPFRHMRFPDGPTIALAIAASGLVGATALGIHLLRGVPGRLPAAVARYAAGSHDQNPRRSETIGLSAAAVDAGGRVCIGQCEPDFEPRFALWGDSHADAVVPLFDRVAKDFGVSGLAFTKGVTPPLVDTVINVPDRFTMDEDFTRATGEQLGRACPPYVVLVARWSVYLEWGVAADADDPRSVDDKVDALTLALERTCRKLRDGGAQRIWLAREVPGQDFDVPRRLALSTLFGTTWPRAKSYDRYSADMRNAERVLQACVSRANDIAILDFCGPVFDAGNPLVTEDGRPVYWDSNHISVAGSRLLDDEVRQLLSQMKNAAIQPQPESHR